MNSANAVIILCTTPDNKTAEHIAKHLVEQRLAACVTLIPGVTSVYLWEDKLEQTKEIQLLIKTHCKHQAAVLETIKAAHPYTVPELLVLPIQSGDAQYLSWLHASLT